VPLLCALHNDYGADHLGSRIHVEVQRFAILWLCKDQGVGQGRLQLVKHPLGLGGPGETLVLLEETVER
jgi:hypothetical protein